MSNILKALAVTSPSKMMVKASEEFPLYFRITQEQYTELMDMTDSKKAVIS